jgi:hypothetical protein
MQLQDLFGIIMTASYGTLTKKVLFKMVRAIIRNRKSIGLKNDVAALYCNSDVVVKMLENNHFPDAEYLLSDVFQLSNINKYLEKTNVLKSHHLSDEETTTGTTTDDTTSDDDDTTSDDDDTTSDDDDTSSDDDDTSSDDTTSDDDDTSSDDTTSDDDDTTSDDDDTTSDDDDTTYDDGTTTDDEDTTTDDDTLDESTLDVIYVESSNTGLYVLSALNCVLSIITLLRVSNVF